MRDIMDIVLEIMYKVVDRVMTHSLDKHDKDSIAFDIYFIASIVYKNVMSNELVFVIVHGNKLPKDDIWYSILKYIDSVYGDKLKEIESEFDEKLSELDASDIDDIKNTVINIVVESINKYSTTEDCHDGLVPEIIYVAYETGVMNAFGARGAEKMFKEVEKSGVAKVIWKDGYPISIKKEVSHESNEA